MNMMDADNKGKSANYSGIEMKYFYWKKSTHVVAIEDQTRKMI